MSSVAVVHPRPRQAARPQRTCSHRGVAQLSRQESAGEHQASRACSTVSSPRSRHLPTAPPILLPAMRRGVGMPESGRIRRRSNKSPIPMILAFMFLPRPSPADSRLGARRRRSLSRATRPSQCPSVPGRFVVSLPPPPPRPLQSGVWRARFASSTRRSSRAIPTRCSCTAWATSTRRSTTTPASPPATSKSSSRSATWAAARSSRLPAYPSTPSTATSPGSSERAIVSPSPSRPASPTDAGLSSATSSAS